MKVLIALTAAVLLLSGMVLAQSSSGTMNSLSTNPRQNQELTNSTGTESGQPTDAVPGSESQPNGLVPETTNMVGSGSNGNMSQSTPASKPAAPGTPEQKKAAAASQQQKNTGATLSEKQAARTSSSNDAQQRKRNAPAGETDH